MPLRSGAGQAAIVSSRHAMVFDVAFALDRSNRKYDESGYLHVKDCIITSAVVSPYLGREINDHKKLGLDPDRIYKVFRDPEALKKSVLLYNNLPILSEHAQVSSESLPQELISGALSNPRWQDPHIVADTVFWTKSAIDDVEDESKPALSCGYWYDIEMQSGVHDGVPYDLRMTNIVPNHLAQVKRPRVPLAAVADALPAELEVEGFNMKVDLKSISRALKKRFGTDASPEELAKLLHEAAAALEKKSGGEGEGENPVVAKAEGEGEEKGKDDLDPTETDPGEADTPAEGAEVVAAAVMQAVQEAVTEVGGEEDDDDDTDPEEEKKGPPMTGDNKPGLAPVIAAPRAKDAPITRAAMDAALAAHGERTRESYRALRAAEKAVRPWVGDLAMDHDSADAVYRTTLTLLGVKGVDKIHPSAYPALLDAQPRPGARAARIAVDSAAGVASGSFAERYPAASRIRIV